MSLRDAEMFCGQLRNGETILLKSLVILTITCKRDIPEETEESEETVKMKRKLMKNLTKKTTGELEKLSRDLVCFKYVNDNFKPSLSKRK